MANAHDQMHIDQPCVARRTIFVDTLKVKATDFHFGQDTQTTLFDNGREAAARFLDGAPGQPAWDFPTYIAECRT